MRIGVAILVGLLIWLQYSLWLGEHNWRVFWEHKSRLTHLEQKVNRLKRQNAELRAEVENLRTVGQAIERRAREDLGMIREGEIFIRVIEPPTKR